MTQPKYLHHCTLCGRGVTAEYEDKGQQARVDTGMGLRVTGPDHRYVSCKLDGAPFCLCLACMCLVVETARRL